MDTTIDRLVRILDEERTQRKDHAAFATRQIADLSQQKIDLQNKLDAARRERNSFSQETNLWEAKVKEWEAYADAMEKMLRRGAKPLDRPGFPDCYIPF